MQRKNYFYEYYSGSDFPFAADGKTDLSTAGTPQGSEYYKKEARLASYFMDAHYSYEDKYYVSGSFRRIIKKLNCIVQFASFYNDIL